MRRIVIDDKVEKIAQDYKDNLFSTHTSAGFIKPVEGLKALERDIKAHGDTWTPEWRKYAAYVRNLWTHFDKIVLLRPKEFDGYARLYFSKLTVAQLTDKKWRNPNGKLSFSDVIIQKMRYKDVRSEDMIPCIKKLGIRSCVYCNAQYSNSVDVTDTGEVKGRYELDHFYPKDEFPFLCISFYNLQPSCSSCNKWKSTYRSLFNLYAEKDEVQDPFTFELTAASIIRYMLYQRAEDLDVKLNSTDVALLANHLQRFHTEDLYRTFNDEIEELVWKFKSFNDTFKQQLVNSFTNLFPMHASRNDIIRFLYGFYEDPDDVHKRPLTKAKQDIARQLKMI